MHLSLYPTSFPLMRPFHLQCPYTSLPFCHCCLHVATPIHKKAPRPPKSENPLRRALLLEMYYSLLPPPGAAQSVSPDLLHAIHRKSTNVIQSSQHPISVPIKLHFRQLDERAERSNREAHELREKSDTLAEELDKLTKARENTDSMERDRLENTGEHSDEKSDDSQSEADHDSADESFERRRAVAIAKRKSNGRHKSRRLEKPRKYIT